LNKVLGDENIGEFGLDGDNVFEWLYTSGIKRIGYLRFNMDSGRDSHVKVK
jgi:hypothetical protein